MMDNAIEDESRRDQYEVEALKGEVCMSLFSREFRELIKLGKYSRWAADIDEDRLIMLIQAVDTYATAINKAMEKTGVNETASLLSARQRERVELALEILVQIHAGETVKFRMPSGWDQGFDDDKAALPKSTRDRFKASPSTAWAESISERSLALLFWMAEEFSCRNSLIFDKSGLMTNRVLNGLAAISYVQHQSSGSGSPILGIIEKACGGIEFDNGSIKTTKGSR